MITDFKNWFKGNNGGFTLIEIMVVISIIGLLSSIIITNVISARNKANIANGQRFDSQLYHGFGDQTKAQWLMDECEGVTVHDSSFSDKKSDGTLNGLGVTWSTVNTPGNTKCSLQFDGQYGTYITTSFDPSKQLGQDFSISAWVYPTDANSYQGVAGGHFDYKGIIYIQYQGSGWFCSVGAGSGWLEDNSFSLPLNQWSHVVCVFSGGNFIRSYINGRLEKDTPISSNITHYDAFWIGRAYNNDNSDDEDDGGSRNFKGNISQLRVYGKALLSEEISKIYAEELPRYYLATQ